MVWFWRPRNRPVPTVDEEGYMCCCQSITAKDGFSAFILLDITVLAYSIFTLVIPEPAYKTFYYGYTPLVLLMIILAIYAVKTLKPIYIQIYVIIYFVQTIFAVFLAGLLLFTALFVSFGLLATEFEEIPNSSVKANRENSLLVTTFMEVAAVIFLGLTIWRVLVTYKFYKYVIDHQLSLEQSAAGTVKYSNQPPPYSRY